MKKHLLRIFLTALCLTAMNMVKAQHLYILGSDNLWNPSQPSATLDEDPSQPGVYEGDVSFTNLYFSIGRTLGANADDWGTFNAQRLGPTEPDKLMQVGVPEQMVQGVDRSFRVPAFGDYHLTVDLNLMTVTLSGTFASELYIVGGNGAWDPTTPSATLPVGALDGTYYGTMQFDGSPFIITSKLATADEALDPTCCYGAAYDGAKVRVNYEMALAADGFAYTSIEPGTYSVNVDLNSMVLRISKNGYEPALPYTFYLHKHYNGGYTDTSVLEVDERQDGAYVGRVVLNTADISFSSAYDPSLEPDNLLSLQPASADGARLTPNLTAVGTVAHAAPAHFTVDASEEHPWEGYVAVDMNTGRVLLYGSDDAYPEAYPHELYMIGNMNAWNYTLPTNVLHATLDEGLYTGQVDISNGDFFGVLKRLGPSWPFVNQTRLMPEEDGEEVMPGQTTFAYDGDAAAWRFSGESGTYTVTVNLQAMTLRMEKVEVDGLDSVKAEGNADSDAGALYDLTGRRVSAAHPQPGIYVKQGRKMVVK